MKLTLIVAVSENFGIGIQGKIPWMLRKEMAHFSKMTKQAVEGKQNVVLMGRKTWDSLPVKFRPLPNRINVVLSRSENGHYPPNVLKFSSFQEAIEGLKSCSQQNEIDKIWVIGGSSIYEEAMKSDMCNRIYLTLIQKSFECDVFFPKIPEEFVEIQDDSVSPDMQEENGICYCYKVYEKRKPTAS